MAILYTAILFLAWKFDYGRDEPGSAATGEEAGGSSGLLRRRLDQPYAARAQIPENMYANATGNMTTLEYRSTT
jgi:hypothetical protein